MLNVGMILARPQDLAVLCLMATLCHGPGYPCEQFYSMDCWVIGNLNIAPGLLEP